MTSGRRALVGALAAAAGLVALGGSARADEQIDLDIGPKTDITVDERACLTAEVTNDRGLPVRRAQIRMLAKRKKTDGSGEAVLCGRFRSPGTQAVHVFKGPHHDIATLEAGRDGAPGDPLEGWWPIEIQLPAYPSAPFGGTCTQGANLPNQDGQCSGIPNANADTLLFEPPPYVLASWTNFDSESKVFTLTFDQPGFYGGATMSGFAREAPGKYWVSFIAVHDDSPYVWTVGSDPALAGEQGGPLIWSVSGHKANFFVYDGKTFHVKGWAYRSLSR